MDMLFVAIYIGFAFAFAGLGIAWVVKEAHRGSMLEHDLWFATTLSIAAGLVWPIAAVAMCLAWPVQLFIRDRCPKCWCQQ